MKNRIQTLLLSAVSLVLPVATWASEGQPAELSASGYEADLKNEQAADQADATAYNKAAKTSNSDAAAEAKARSTLLQDTEMLNAAKRVHNSAKTAADQALVASQTSVYDADKAAATTAAQNARGDAASVRQDAAAIQTTKGKINDVNQINALNAQDRSDSATIAKPGADATAAAQAAKALTTDRQQIATYTRLLRNKNLSPEEAGTYEGDLSAARSQYKTDRKAVMTANQNVAADDSSSAQAKVLAAKVQLVRNKPILARDNNALNPAPPSPPKIKPIATPHLTTTLPKLSISGSATTNAKFVSNSVGATASKVKKPTTSP